MEDPCCPNYSTCRLVTIPEFDAGKRTRNFYIQQYCLSKDHNWNDCKRLAVKKELFFCPDFVLPDSEITLDEVIDRYDEKEMN